VSLCGNDSYTKEWQPFQLLHCMTYTLTHHGNERQQSVNNLWSCVLGSQDLARIYELISELLTAFICKNTIYRSKKSDSKIINIAICITCKKRSLAAEYVNLVRYNYQTAKASALYASTFGPAGQPAVNPVNSDWLGDLLRTVP